MNEEEKKAIEYLKKHIMPYGNKKGNIEFLINDVLLNLIDKQQKELKKLKEIEQAHKEENGKLRVELEEEKEKNKKQFDILCKYEDKLEFYEDKVFDELGKVINLDKIKELDKISVKGKKYIAQYVYDKQIIDIFNKLNSEFAKDYISKDKIKEIIETSSYPDFAIQKIIEFLEMEEK